MLGLQIHPILQVKDYNDLFDKYGMSQVSEKIVGSWHLNLVRKSIDTKNFKHIEITTDHMNFEWLETLKDDVRGPEDKRIWLKSTNFFNGLVGSVKCLHKEPNCERVRCIETDDGVVTEDIKKRDAVFYMNGGCYQYDDVDKNQWPSIKTHSFQLNMRTIGDLSTFSWFKQFEPKQFCKAFGIECNEVTVYYAALNFKDILIATNRIPLSSNSSLLDIHSFFFGHEYSDVCNGRRIIGTCSAGSIASKVPLLTDVDFTFDLLDLMVLE